jgi:alpha-glucosidase
MKLLKGAFLILAWNLFLPLQAIAFRNGLIAPQVAVFYPSDFDAKAHLPSFALLKEPKVSEPIPKNWSMTPTFYQKEGKSVTAIPIPKGASLYGTGEVTGPLQRNGQSIILWNTDNFTYKDYDGKRLYQSHPWVLGVNLDGTVFGVLSDNTWRQNLVLNDSIIFIAESPAARVIVFQKKNIGELLRALTDLVGKIELPPLWSLGYQQSRWSYEPESRVREIASEFRNRKIPCDVIWMDIDYMDGFRVFTFDKSKFSNPKALNDDLHRMKFKSVWMIDPGVKLDSTYFVYRQAQENNLWVKDASKKDFIGEVWPGPCKFPDFTMPETRKWWANLYTNFLQTNIDGVWNDMNEPAVFEVQDHSMPVDNFHRGGGSLVPDSHLRYHNVYGMLMIHASCDGILAAKPDKRPFILSRAGYLGSHRYGATWTGDNKASWEHLKMSIPMVINLGLSGQSFSGPDIGGFEGNTDPVLFAHWIALGAFYPFSRGHACKGTNNKEPWSFGSEIENVARVALNRRYKLLPYTYTLFHEASVTGIPVMRPLFFADVKDTSLRREEQAFLLGPDLMVVPKWAHAPRRPKGNWRIISIAGENSRTDNYQPDVSIREGSIVPLSKIIQNTVDYSTDSLTLLLSLDGKGEARGHLYEDEGDGFGYKQGNFSEYEFKAKSKNGQVRIKTILRKGVPSSCTKWYKIVLVNNKGSVESDWKGGEKGLACQGDVIVTTLK